ncbi:hypothetical protein EVAR_58_1 [Eumeta japonica]|uniref:Uncharacterized protein n=1 Tax=Eumeta variegata TaxID=151549 RepID=A0A4C1SBE5_EUMVA|nr:hypothetical protein EVAR_58_1 [Eumeta japonica]
MGSENSGGPPLPLPLHNPDPLFIRHPIRYQEAGNALETPLGLRVSMGGGDHLLSDGWPARLPLEYA